jgi:hypothetical protein
VDRLRSGVVRRASKAYQEGCGRGTKGKEGPILLEDLMSDQVLDLPENNIGLYMPAELLKKRLHYQWFCKMSETQVLECNCAFSYYILGVKKECDCNRIE